MAKTASLVAATLAALCLCQSPARALSNRAWVSGHGSDAAGCGSPTSPCRSFQYVHDNIVAAGGEIDVLDAAGYGAIAITKALSIVNDGVGTAGVQASSGNAITVDISYADTVVLRGLSIEGLGTATNGVALTSSGTLAVENCTVSDTTGAGVSITPTHGGTVTIADTTVANNNGAGVSATASSGGSLVLSLVRVKAINNGFAGTGVGVQLAGASASYGYVTIDSSFLAQNTTGLTTSAPATNLFTVFMTNSVLVNNGQSIKAGAATAITIERTSISSINGGITNNGSITSFGDNAITDDVTGTPITTKALR